MPHQWPDSITCGKEAGSPNKQLQMQRVTNISATCDIDRKENIWLSRLTKATGTTDELWVIYLDDRGFNTGDLETDQFNWLGSIGFTAPTLDARFEELYSVNRTTFWERTQ